MRIELPDFSVIALVGASGCGKSHFAQKHFRASEILNSDMFRELISDDPSDQEASLDAFECLYHVAGKRLDRRRLTVVDATHLHRAAREKTLSFAKENNCLAVAIVFNVPETICQERNANRKDRQTPAKTVSRHCRELETSLRSIKKEGFHRVYFVGDQDEELEIVRVPLWTDMSAKKGPFDIIGDVHGCYDELCALLEKLGYNVNKEHFIAIPPDSRCAVFLGDLCDRGPASVSVLRLVMNMHTNGYALCVPGNHDDKLSRLLSGKKVSIANGLEKTLQELDGTEPGFRQELGKFLRGLVSHYLLDEGKLVVAHAGLKEKMHGRASARVREFCLYGDVDGSLDEYGLPLRMDWASGYRGKALVAYGHSPQTDTAIINNTICLDAGCVFGGKLAALRYPEMEVVSVPALRQYCVPIRPLEAENIPNTPQIDDVLGKKRITTGLLPVVHINEESSLAALESMGRYAVDPRWLIYLPPTMSPCETSSQPGYLEYPAEAFNYYAKHGITEVVCEEKHMGSRAIAVVCNDCKAAGRFGFREGAKGRIYTRTGRPFFIGGQKNFETSLLEKLAGTLEELGFWQEYHTDWICLDCEIMPWSFKARLLLEKQYAPVGHAGMEGISAAIESLAKCGNNDKICFSQEEACSLASLAEKLAGTQDCLNKYNKVWQSYCYPANTIEDIKIAPFHIMATEGIVWSKVGHLEQLETIKRFLGSLSGFVPTRHLHLKLDEKGAYEKGIDFWLNLTSSGAEGMVVKPMNFIPMQKTSLLQPALKCRGKEYLRIIYGPDYTEKLEQFQKRSLGTKRRRALQEFSLGLEALNRFVNNEPVHRIHECVYGIAALESEPVDPKL